MAWPVIDGDDVAWVGAVGMREIDRVMVEEVGVWLVQMMENAGRWVAEVVRAERGRGAVVVLAGPGGNGGGGLVAARHLFNAGFEVAVVLVGERERLSTVTAHQLMIVEQMGIAVSDRDPIDRVGGADVVVDAMVGYSVQGPLRGAAADACAAANAAPGWVLSLDLPSGVDADYGGAETVVAADATVTLCLPKSGLHHSAAVGRLLVADISVPAAVVKKVAGGPAPLFWMGPLLEISSGSLQ